MILLSGVFWQSEWQSAFTVFALALDTTPIIFSISYGINYCRANTMNAHYSWLAHDVIAPYRASCRLVLADKNKFSGTKYMLAKVCTLQQGTPQWLLMWIKSLQAMCRWFCPISTSILTSSGEQVGDLFHFGHVLDGGVDLLPDHQCLSLPVLVAVPPANQPIWWQQSRRTHPLKNPTNFGVWYLHLCSGWYVRSDMEVMF